MNTVPVEHKWHDFVKHIKENWAESLIFTIFLAALLYLALTSSVSSYL